MPLLPAITEARRSTWTIRKFRDQANQIGAEASRIAGEAIEAVAPLFSGASLDAVTESAARRLGWVLSGLTVQADWIGSNPEWFGPQDAGTPIASYWKQALARAETAIVAAGLHCAAAVRRPTGLGADAWKSRDERTVPRDSGT